MNAFCVAEPNAGSPNHWRVIIAQNGWCDVEVQDQTSFLRLADSLGTRIPSWHGGSTIDRLTILRPNEAPKNSFSYIFGNGAFPFHTDMARHARPPRYVIMRLISASDNVRPTLLIDFRHLSLTNGVLACLQSEVWTVKGRPPFVSSVITSLSPSCQMLRYDPVCMKPTSIRAEIAGKELESQLAGTIPMSFRWQPHRALVIDNWRVLHARPAEHEAGDTQRILERVQVLAEEES